MPVELVIPKLGMTMQEGTLASWLKADGEPVAVGEAVFVLETEKVETDVEAEAAGVLRHAVAEGTTLPTGAVVGWLVDPADATPDPAAFLSASPRNAEVRLTRKFVSPNARRLAGELGVEVEGLTGSGPNGRVVGADVRAAASVPARVPAAASAKASVAARMLAERLGVDLAEVAPLDGKRVTRQDVEQAVAARLNGPERNGSRPHVGPSIPMHGMRAVIAERMHRSLHEMAQLTIGSEVFVDRLLDLRADLKADRKADVGADGPAPTITDFAVRAAAIALRRHPALNASIIDGAIVVHDEIDIGVAVALDDGLVVPVVRGADRLPVSALADRTRALAERARDRRLLPDDMEGATFCVTSLGSRGVDFFTPVINPPNVAILGIGRARETVRFEERTPVPAHAMTLSLTFDHRAIDGAPAADFLATVCAALNQPGRLL